MMERSAVSGLVRNCTGPRPTNPKRKLANPSERKTHRQVIPMTTTEVMTGI